MEKLLINAYELNRNTFRDSWNFYFLKNGKVFYYGYLKNFEQKLREWLKKGKKKDRVIDIASLFAIRKWKSRACIVDIVKIF